MCGAQGTQEVQCQWLSLQFIFTAQTEQCLQPLLFTDKKMEVWSGQVPCKVLDSEGEPGRLKVFFLASSLILCNLGKAFPIFGLWADFEGTYDSMSPECVTCL